MIKQKAVICEKEISQVYFEEMKNDVPSMEYYSWIAKTLGCDFSQSFFIKMDKIYKNYKI